MENLGNLLGAMMCHGRHRNAFMNKALRRALQAPTSMHPEDMGTASGQAQSEILLMLWWICAAASNNPSTLTHFAHQRVAVPFAEVQTRTHREGACKDWAWKASRACRNARPCPSTRAATSKPQSTVIKIPRYQMVSSYSNLENPEVETSNLKHQTNPCRESASIGI